MIITANQIYGVATRCTDGCLGKVDDLLFDDRSWNVTSVVIRLGGWLQHQRVLVTPADIEATEWSTGRLCLRLSQSRLRTAPSLESNPPVAMQKWRELQVVAWDGFWSGVLNRMPGDPHLRNTRAVTGYRVLGLDAKAGYIDSFVIDDETWQIRYLVVRVGRRRTAKRVVLEPRWVESIAWEDRRVQIHLPRTEIEHAREFAAKELGVTV
jgi:hypothetical protein